MTFAEWFQRYWLRDDETKTDGLGRLAPVIGVSYKSLHYARRGAQCSASTARRIYEFTDRKVSLESLILAPTRSELRAKEEEQASAAA